MKTTYLIYKQVEGTRKLVVATHEEWNAVLNANKGLPMEKRRLFIKDELDDGNDYDCIFIETTLDEYRKWHNSIRTKQRNHEVERQYLHLSLDAPIQDKEVSSLHEVVSSGVDEELRSMDSILLDELTDALVKWKPWAKELLALYLAGEGRTCTACLCEKYHVSYRAIQKRKKAFEKFVLKFLKK